MSRILVKGIVRNGRVEVEQPINLPDGSEVTITGYPNGKFVGLPDSGGPMTPEEMAATLEAMDKVEPFDMTDEERAARESERQARKEWEKAHFAERAEKLRRMWDGEDTSPKEDCDERD
jgi:hypothetical protein